MKKIRILILISAMSVISPSAFGAARTGHMTEEVAQTKFLNVRVNPLGLALGSLSGEADFRIGDKFTIGPSLSHFSANFFFTELTGWGIGARSNYYLTGSVFQDSWIVGTSVGLSTTKVRLGNEEASNIGAFVHALIGYQFVFKSGLNLQLALGGSWFSQDSEMTTDQGTVVDVPFYHGIKPAAEFTVGYLF
jgi:hypothetical protein